MISNQRTRDTIIQGGIVQGKTQQGQAGIQIGKHSLTKEGLQDYMGHVMKDADWSYRHSEACLLYTSDAADE